MAELGAMTNPIHVPGCKPKRRDAVCRGHRYVCPACKRWCGWCFGAADKYGKLCDDCAIKAFTQDDIEEARTHAR